MYDNKTKEKLFKLLFIQIITNELTSSYYCKAQTILILKY